MNGQYFFHGSLEEFKSQIEDHGYNKSCGLSHYLGDGIYFYDNQELAQTWAKKKAKKFKEDRGFSGRYVVFKCYVDVEKCKILNLTDKFHYKNFQSYCVLHFSEQFKLRIRGCITEDEKARIRAAYYFNSYCEVFSIDIIKADVQLNDDFANTIRIVGLHELQYNIRKADLITNNNVVYEYQEDLNNYETF